MLVDLINHMSAWVKRNRRRSWEISLAPRRTILLPMDDNDQRWVPATMPYNRCMTNAYHYIVFAVLAHISQQFEAEAWCCKQPCCAEIRPLLAMKRSHIPRKLDNESTYTWWKISEWSGLVVWGLCLDIIIFHHGGFGAEVGHHDRFKSVSYDIQRLRTLINIVEMLAVQRIGSKRLIQVAIGSYFFLT